MSDKPQTTKRGMLGHIDFSEAARQPAFVKAFDEAWENVGGWAAFERALHSATANYFQERIAAQPTPGPWFYDGPSDSTQAHIIHVMEGEIAEAFSEAFTSEQAHANARLIAAAPDLLEALLIALPFVEDCESEPMYKPGAVKKCIKHIRAVIENATGDA